MNWTIRTKLFVSFGVIIAIMISLGIYSIYTLKTVNDKATEIADNWLPGVDKANRLNTLLSSHRVKEYRHIVSTSDQEMTQMEQEMDAIEKDFNKYMSEYEKTIADDTDRRLAAAVKKNWETYKETTKQVMAFSRQQKTNEAMNIMRGDSLRIYQQASATLLELVEFNSKNGEKVSAEGDKLYDNSKLILTGILVLVALLASMIAFYISRQLSAAINELLKVSRQVASGNLSEFVVVSSRDELGLLAESFNEMIKNLKTLISQINSTSQNVAAASEELNASAEQTAQATNQVAGVVSEVAQGAEVQVAAADKTAKDVEQMTATIRQVADNADRVAGISGITMEKAASGGAAINSAIGQMNNVEKTVNNSAAIVMMLGERSKEIGQIVDTISGIAGQTNLLALNAAIEAARAGEQGRGFAVVAEEVRKLAEQSQEAAKQIAELIRGIQDETGKAVVAMNEGTKEVKLGAEVINSAGVTFKEIVGMISQVSGDVGQASAALQKLANGSQQVVTSIREMDKISKETAGQTQTVSAATEEQSAAMEEIAVSSRNLAKMAEELQNAVSKFKI